MSSYHRPRIAAWPAAARRTVLMAALVLITGAISCGKSHHQQLFNENHLPTVVPASVQVDTSITHPTTWNVSVSWAAHDDDGSIDHIEYAIDPTAQESVWVSTTANPLQLVFPVKHRDSNGYIVPEFHVLALRARDNRLEASPVVSLALYAVDVPPLVRFDTPQPSAFLDALVPPGFSVTWTGDDPDGYPTRHPAGYRVRAVLESDPDFTLYRMSPDSLLQRGGASNWAGWSQYGADAGGEAFPVLPLGARGLIAVVAFDAQGVHTSHLDLNENVLQFEVAGVMPGAHFQTPLFDISVEGGLRIGGQPPPQVEFPGSVQLELRWDSSPLPGSRILYTRWMLDGSPGDTSTRVDPTDVHHWSARITTLPASATVGPFTDPGGTHTFWLEIADDVHRASLTGLRFFVVSPLLNRDLLIVDDTRLEADKFPGPPPGTGAPAFYTKVWPSASELDTFLYARGGVPWRGLRGGATANSVPGLFAGYSFDTLGTRLGLEDPAQAVSLSRLAQYRHVLWLVDQVSALNGGSLNPLIFPVTALRTMSQPGHTNVLAAYVSMGGQVWLAGGGATYATLIAYDNRSNNLGSTTVFKHEPVGGSELGPGRLLYDMAHIRSAISVTIAAGIQLARSPAARGGWLGHGPDGTLRAPDYSHLPAQLRLRDPSTDPLTPTRTGSSPGFYPATSDFEYVSEPNEIVEDMDPDPGVVHVESTLDTLIEGTGIGFTISPAPLMTYYHGRENAPFLFSGINLWSWTRDDAQTLVDFVLGDVWGMSRSGPRGMRASAPARGAPPRQAGPGSVRVQRLDPP